MSRWAFAWIVWVAAFFAIELPALRTPGHTGTLSHQMHRLGHLHTRPGRYLFTITIAAGCGVFLAHMLKPPRRTLGPHLNPRWEH